MVTMNKQRRFRQIFAAVDFLELDLYWNFSEKFVVWLMRSWGGGKIFQDSSHNIKFQIYDQPSHILSS